MNAGEYARLKNGEIVKIVDIKVYYVLGQNAKDDYSCVTTKNNDFPSLIKNDFIAKKGKIIDLIECDDIVINQLGEIIRPTSSNIDELKDYWKICKNPIKQILTHEQFENEAYRVEE